MISFNCVQCGKKFLTPEHLAGRQGKCARCGTTYEIPQPGGPSGDVSPSGATGTYVAFEGAREEPPEPDVPKIRFACEECGRKFAMSTSLIGNAGSCPDCGAMFLVPPYSDGEAPPPPPPPPAPPVRTTRPTATIPSPQVSAHPTPVRTTKPTASVPAPQVSAHPTPTRTSRPTTTMPAPQFRPMVEPQRTTKPTTTMPAASPVSPSKSTATLPSASSLVEVRSDKPFLTGGREAPSDGTGSKGLVAAVVLCVIAAGGAFWAWKSTSSQPAGTSTAGTDASNPAPPQSAPPPRPVPAPVTHTTAPPEEPVLTPPVEEPPPDYHEDPPPIEPTPPPIDPTQPPTPTDPASMAAPVPDAAQVNAAIAEFERQRGYVRDCLDAIQQARALDPLASVVVDARVIDILGKLLASTAELPLVRKRAAEMLGDSQSPEAAAPLQAGFDANRSEPEVARAVIISLGGINSAASVKALSAAARGWMKAADEERDHMYASVAVLSISEVRRSEAVDALLGFWAGLVAAKPADTSGLSETGWKHESHRAELEVTTQSSLCVLTGQALTTYDEWQAWWEEHRGSFKFNQ
ncbi:MAG: HEAT repeat domain-containing protein [Planctomycetota bacterium]